MLKTTTPDITVQNALTVGADTTPFITTRYEWKIRSTDYAATAMVHRPDVKTKSSTHTRLLLGHGISSPSLKSVQNFSQAEKQIIFHESGWHKSGWQR